jgi:hypothetical protein
MQRSNKILTLNATEQGCTQRKFTVIFGHYVLRADQHMHKLLDDDVMLIVVFIFCLHAFWYMLSKEALRMLGLNKRCVYIRIVHMICVTFGEASANRQ